MADLSNKFITQSEVDDKRKRRQEEWEQKRKPDDPMECPEADNRSLYDKLQEQKMKKDEEYEEQHKLKNSVKGLNEDEAHFLEFVSNKQLEIEKARSDEEKSLFKEIKHHRECWYDTTSENRVFFNHQQFDFSTSFATESNRRMFEMGRRYVSDDLVLSEFHLAWDQDNLFHSTLLTNTQLSSYMGKKVQVDGSPSH
ncbi:Hypothetical predicted protein [Mytilus galloprovincialis]|uniref:FAM192A/Fyv6 N-terminal domain-containing protein n=1 Tax=Mytilus galloprovincialis TaxID=29158 RepID=A0A8B6E1I6_MYTGA|nr:Hypothetical predicted protein [Mytilus galloprovincialis]